MEHKSNLLDFSIYHKDVALAVDKNIAGNEIPCFVFTVLESPHFDLAWLL